MRRVGSGNTFALMFYVQATLGLILLLTFDASCEETPGDYVVTTPTHVYVEPSETSTSQANLERKTIISVIGSRGHWLQVRSVRGVIGYVAAKDVEPLNGDVIKPDVSDKAKEKKIPVIRTTSPDPRGPVVKGFQIGMSANDAVKLVNEKFLDYFLNNKKCESKDRLNYADPEGLWYIEQGDVPSWMCSNRQSRVYATGRISRLEIIPREVFGGAPDIAFTHRQRARG